RAAQRRGRRFTPLVALPGSKTSQLREDGAMSKAKTAAPAANPATDGVAKLLREYGCGPVAFTGTDDALYERRLVFDHVLDPEEAGPREQFEALASALRDVLAQRWVKTIHHHDRVNPKQVYYLSMEFLIGRSLMNNVTNLLLAP